MRMVVNNRSLSCCPLSLLLVPHFRPNFPSHFLFLPIRYVLQHHWQLSPNHGAVVRHKGIGVCMWVWVWVRGRGRGGGRGGGRGKCVDGVCIENKQTGEVLRRAN